MSSSASSWLRQSFGAWKVRGKQNLAAWATAGVIVYYVWVKPERDAAAARKKEREAARELAQVGYRDKVRPMPDPQETGLRRGGTTSSR